MKIIMTNANDWLLSYQQHLACGVLGLRPNGNYIWYIKNTQKKMDARQKKKKRQRKRERPGERKRVSERKTQTLDFGYSGMGYPLPSVCKR